MANFTHANILFAHCLPPRNIYTFIHEHTQKNTFKKGANLILVIIVSDLFFLNS